MDTKTRRILIGVCVVALLLTSTFTWGVISAGNDLAQIASTEGRVFSRTSADWILAHANFLVPVFFLGAIISLVMKKPTSDGSSPRSAG